MLYEPCQNLLIDYIVRKMLRITYFAKTMIVNKALQSAF